MAEKQFADEQVAVLEPIINRLLAMLAVARDAFNRHSRASIQELQTLQKEMAHDLNSLATQLKSLTTKRPEAERPLLLRLQSILNHLEIVSENIRRLENPIQKKIKDGVLFSDKAVTQVNYLFDQHLGVIRSVLDIVKTDNGFLKKYVTEESRKLVQTCADFATEHEDRMIEGLCLPQAAPLFLAILDSTRIIGEHEMEIAGLLAKNK